MLAVSQTTSGRMVNGATLVGVRRSAAFSRSAMSALGRRKMRKQIPPSRPSSQSWA
jgi:hypothetical protein